MSLILGKRWKWLLVGLGEAMKERERSNERKRGEERDIVWDSWGLEGKDGK